VLRFEYDGVPEDVHAYREVPRVGNAGPPEWINPPKPDFSDVSRRRMESCAADPDSCMRSTTTSYGDFEQQPRRNMMADLDDSIGRLAWEQGMGGASPTCGGADEAAGLLPGAARGRVTS
jgi:hypothetical protein